MEWLNTKTGEVVYGITDSSNKEDLKKVRHGYGIQLYGKNEEKNFLVRYAG